MRNLQTIVLSVVVSATTAGTFSGLAAPVTVIGPPRATNFTMRIAPSPRPIVFEVKRTPTPGGYVVVTPAATYEDPAWKQVVTGLAVKHRAVTLVYDGRVESVRDELAKRMPAYTCFVAKPEQAGRGLVVAVHRLTRRLNADPYTDTIWGILTGYSAKEAARIVAESKPLIIRRGAGGTSIPLEQFDSGIWYDEGKKNHAVQKTADGKVAEMPCPDDTTKALTDVFNYYKPDYFVTSGHATERDWQIGYSYRNGQFRCRDGVLMGVDMQRNEYPIHSPNPKVYTAIGNCLMGDVIDNQAMALAWMGSAGVDQMVGYTVETWYGYGGWGLNNYFLDQPGRFTLAESFFLANQALQYQIQKRFPELNKVNFNDWGPSGVCMPKLANAINVTSMDGDEKDKLGLMWDRDTVAFYGDPAWTAKLAPKAEPWEQSVKVSGKRFTITLTAAKGADCGRPPAIALPRGVGAIKVVSGTKYTPIIAGRFVMLPGITRMEPGKEYKVVFDATDASAAGSAATSGLTEALRKAGSNKPQLEAAIKAARTADQRSAVSFLIANMPARDLASVKKDYLLSNVLLAYAAKNETPWGASIPDDIFLNEVVPFANVTETRDNWRKDFHDRFMPVVKSCKTASEAALKLNSTIFETLKVQYHATKRPRPDQSPYESTAAHYASCTGLCVLLADACRAVGVPARLVGTPSWVLLSDTHVTAGGNHTWVEIWDGGWHFLGASEESKLDDTWFVDSAKRADDSDPIHRIYAVSFRKTDTSFPMVWAPDVKDVYAEDVTERYKSLSKPG